MPFLSAALGAFFANSGIPPVDAYVAIDFLTGIPDFAFYFFFMRWVQCRKEKAALSSSVLFVMSTGYGWIYVHDLSPSDIAPEAQKLRPSSMVTLANGIKELVKKRIDALEILDEVDLEDLIKLIRTVDSDKKDSGVYVIDGRRRATAEGVLTEESKRDDNPESGQL